MVAHAGWLVTWPPATPRGGLAARALQVLRGPGAGGRCRPAARPGHAASRLSSEQEHFELQQQHVFLHPVSQKFPDI